MSKIFETLRMKGPGYSAFDLSHERKLTCEMGQLIPIMVEEIIPGDHYSVNTEIMLRFAPMIAPIMHRVNVYVHYFFVPNRIIWDDWEDFITGGQLGLTSPTMPELTIGTEQATAGSISDYMGIASGSLTGGGQNEKVSQLAYRAYAEIWNEYYRDETLQTKIDITNEGQINDIQTRCWEKDYYTSSLPWTQRGAEVNVPITFDADGISPIGTAKVWDTANPTGAQTSVVGDLTTTSGGLLVQPGTGAGAGVGTIDNTDNLNITINDLRVSSRLQEWLEKNARGGFRYIEQLLSHFGVKSSDSRLQRPEYLGGGRQPVVISEVLNTSATATEEQGTMAGHGIAVGTNMRARKRFEEHGWLMGIMSVLPRTNYQNGIPRKFSRKDKLDYYFPEFAHLGEQEVLQKEIWYALDETTLQHDAVFGYQQRYAEYKYGCSSVHGDFRTTLDFWHMGRNFTSSPSLNEAFVESNPTERIFAVSTGDHIWCQIYNNIKARRPMPYFSNPKL